MYQIFSVCQLSGDKTLKPHKFTPDQIRGSHVPEEGAVRPRCSYRPGPVLDCE